MNTKLCLTKYVKLLGLIIFYVFTTEITFAQCPTVGNLNPTTCAFDGANTTKVSDLINIANITGGNPNIVWYDAIVGGNIIPETDNLADGTYYLDTDNGECSPRIAINVTVDAEGTPSDVIGFASGKCFGETLTDAENGFISIGNDILWYNSQTGGSPLDESTQIFGNTTFYVSYIENGCESQRSIMQFIIIPSLPPVFDMPSIICLLPGETITVEDLDQYVTNSNGFEITWYNTEDDANTDYPGDGDSSNDPLLSSEIVVDDEDYWAVIESLPCPSTPGVIIPNLEIQPQTGTPNPLGPFCESEGINVTLPTNSDLISMLNGAVDAGGEWTEDSGTNELSDSSDTSINIQNIYESLGVGSYSFTYTVTNGVTPDTCEASTTITIVIDPVLVAGNATTPIVICENNLTSNFDLFTALTGYDNGGAWTDDSATGALTNNILNLTVIPTPYDASGYEFTYTVNDGTACPVDSETVTILIREAPELEINSPENFCLNDNTLTNINLNDYLITDSSSGNGIWSDTGITGALTLPNTVNIATLQALGEGSYTFNYLVDNGDGCANDIDMIIIIDPENEAGIGNNTIICETNLVSDFDLFTLLTDNDNGGTWTDDDATGALTNNILDLMAISTPYDSSGYEFTYTVSNGICPDDTTTVIVTLVETPEAGTDQNVNICISAASPTSIDLFTVLIDEENGGNWIDTSASGALVMPSTVDITTLQALGAATYIYEYEIDNGDGCIDTAQVSIIIEDEETPINENIAICLTDLIEGSIPFTTLDSFVISPSDPVNVDWATDSSTPIATLINLQTGAIDWSAIETNSIPGATTTFIFQALSNTSISCSPDLGNVIVTINDIPEPNYTGTNTYCSFSGAITIQNIINDFTTNLGGVINLYDAITGGTLQDPTNVLLPNTYTFYALEQDSNGSGCESNTRTMVVVTVNENSNAGETGTLLVCTTSNTAIDLFTILNGTPDTGGAWTGPIPSTNGDQGTIDPSLLADGDHDFTYTVTGISPCPDASQTVTITIDPLPNGGSNGPTQNLCSTDAPIDLFSVLAGNPDNGGVWTGPASTSNGDQGTIDPATLSSGDNIFTYNITNSCGAASPAAEVIVNITLTPELINPGNQEACDSFDLSTIAINGTNLSGNQNFYDAPNGGGSILNIITSLGDTTVYLYDETSPTSCSDEESFIVTIIQTPQIDTINPAAVCDSFTFPSITGNNLNSPSYNSEADGSGDSYSSGDLFTPSNSGAYTFYMRDTNGSCNESVSFSVAINKSPDAGIDNNTATTCISDIEFDLTTLLGGTPDTTGTWSPALTSGTNIYSPIEDGENTFTYTVTGTAPCSDSVSTVIITIQDPGIPNVTNQSFCLIDNPTVGDLIAIGTSLQWYDSETSTDVLAGSDSLVDGEDYWVSQTNGCESLRVAMNVTINNPGTPELLSNGNEFCILDRPTIAELELQIINNNNYNIIWYDALTGGDTLNLDTVLVEGETYYASFNNTTTLCNSAERLPIVANLTNCDDDAIVLPNAFSPNGDGENDTFNLGNISVLYPNFKIEIYNRYGNLVYKGNINTPDFDGKSNQSSFISNDILPVGIYFYVIEFNNNSKKPIQGNIYLSR